MAEFKEIDSCIRTSALEHHNINEVFFLCQKAVTHPIAPIYDSKEGALKPAAIEALRRVFWLSDKDQDGMLNDKELHEFQRKCFDKDLSEDELANIKRTIQRWSPETGDEVDQGIDVEGFLLLNKMFAEPMGIKLLATTIALPSFNVRGINTAANCGFFVSPPGFFKI